MAMRKFIFVSVHPIHYNDYLFSEISKSGVDITVYYVNKDLKNYPWKQKLNYSFVHKYCHYFLGIDWRLLWEVVSGRKTTFVVAGWDTFFKNILLLTLMLFRRRYIIFTDTVNYDASRGAMKGRLRALWLTMLFRNTFKILTTGMVGVEAMAKMYGRKTDKILNFPFATDIRYFNTTPAFSTFDNDKVLISSGRLLNSHKGYDVAIKALAIVRDHGYSFRYLLAGTGPDEPMIRQLIKDLNLEQHISLIGWQELDGLKELYASGHIFIHPAHFDPFPNAVLEAMASGLILVASDTSGSATERINTGINGFIFKDNDVASLAKIIEYLLTCDAQRLQAISQMAIATSRQWNVSYQVDIVKKLL